MDDPIESGRELTPAFMATLDHSCQEAWISTYERTNPGSNYVLWRYTAAGTLIFQGGFAFFEDAQKSLRTQERRHPARLYLLWTVPDPQEA